MNNPVSTERDSTVSPIGLLAQLPAMLPDAPSLLRGALGMTRTPQARETIGSVFQKLADRRPDQPFLRFDGDTLSYGDANAQVNRYAAVLTARGVQVGDVVGILMTNRPEALLITLAAVKLGAAAGMINNHQREEVLAHSLGLLDCRVLVIGEECEEAIESLDGPPQAGAVLRVDELDSLAAEADSANPAVTERLKASETAFYIFTSGTTGLPKASVMTHYRWLKSMSGLGGLGRAPAPRRHPVLLPAALSQQRTDGRALVGARLGRDPRARPQVLGVEILGRMPAATVPPRSSTSARSVATCSTSPSVPTTATTASG